MSDRTFGFLASRVGMLGCLVVSAVLIGELWGFLVSAVIAVGVLWEMVSRARREVRKERDRSREAHISSQS